jgi:predicted Ser/Thr protein kinase
MVIAHAIPAATLFSGRYRILEKLAEGSVASIYRALDERGGFEVALKVFDPLRSADPIARLRFEREFAVLSKLDHDGIARALRFERTEDLDVLVMEYIEGDSLEERLARGTLEVEGALALARTLCRTLAICHRAGVIHRDLKPSNIILHASRGPVIVDFGVAWFSTAMTLTRTGAIVGSPRYLAPECFESRVTDERTDVFSLGAILYEGLTGRPARDAESIAELALDGFVDPPLPSTLCSAIPDWLDGVVLRALAARPEDRFATVGELLEAIERERDIPAKRLEAGLPCSSCGVASIIDLPLCPGCGRAREWSLSPGPYAVQVLEARDAGEATAWLRRRHGEALRLHPRWVAKRLERPPVPLAVGISRASADALSAALREIGCRTEIVRERAVLGPPVAAPDATPKEIAAALLLHFVATMVVASCLAFAATPERFVPLAPIAVALFGLFAARFYVRRPLLAVRKRGPQDNLRTPLLEETAARLSRLEAPRARALAAAAVARAAPLFMEAGAFDEDHRAEARAALDDALEAANEIDVHQRAMADSRGDRAAALPPTVEHNRHAGASLAYDLAVKRVLEACEEITRALLPARR